MYRSEPPRAERVAVPCKWRSAQAAFQTGTLSCSRKGFSALREPNERELVQGCLGGDRRCQETLYTRYARRMYAVCLRYARHQLEAQDLMQEGFIRVFEKLSAFRMEGSLEGWIRRIMVHTAINQYRKKSFQQERFGMENLPESPVESLALDNLGEQELMKLIAELPDGYRHVFNLYAIEGFDHAEIAAMLGCGESTSRSQLSKARSYLQARIERKEVLHHAGRTSH
ncbi:MAG TPA: RNA polymerase sigma factor [Flavobacteriales bacterium]|nr:RNA polymerase sigma factor [Flavobacteriales bacterium]